MSSIEVTGLAVYPVKSCSGTQLSQAALTPNGIEFDREWMIVDECDRFISQRTHPELALIRPEVFSNGWGGSLVLNVSGQQSMHVSLHKPAEEISKVEATVHGKPVVGYDEGPGIATWLSTFLQRRVRLLRVSRDEPRMITDRYHKPDSSNQVGFADGFALTLASEASLKQLNSYLPESVPMNRFRPNIVIDGEQLEGFEEDYWRTLRIGNMTAYVVRACARCEIPDTNQVTLERKIEVRRALTRHRRGVDITDPKSPKGMFFMQNLNHIWQPRLMLKVGDSVQVEESDSLPNFEPIKRD